VIELHCGSARSTISAAEGGRVATLTVNGVELILGPDPALPGTGWGSYPMVPWVGRIRNGQFTFDGAEYQLPINFDPHAIHGTGFEQSWSVGERDGRSVVLTCELDWKFGGQAEQLIELNDNSLVCMLAVRACDVPMPATIGWHPWFNKPERVDLRFEKMFVRDDEYIPDGRIVSPPPPPPWDDCFTDPLAPPRVWIGGVEVTITSDCDHWVVYDMPEHATCVEPQTAPADAFNLGGYTRLEPGEELRRTMTISWA
jgi:aldose 1-epimerase